MTKQDVIHRSVTLYSLGCPKNLVDSEIILGLLKEYNYTIKEEPEEADTIIINTCGFIRDAKEESFQLIKRCIELKDHYPEKKIIVIGCLVNRYSTGLLDELPGVDLYIGIDRIPEIPQIISRFYRNPLQEKVLIGRHRSSFLYNEDYPRVRMTPSHYAYIKIAEGCSNRCAYCTIPSIKGPYVSRPLESIIKEAKELIAEGVKEINLIAQDTTNYGIDLYGRGRIEDVLNGISEIEGDFWIRLLYTHPAHIDKELIDIIAKNPRICRYIDIPLQHIDDEILRKMHRKIDSSSIRLLLDYIRETIPDVVLRTTFIVGFPGETEDKFVRLLDFMYETKFERLGIFKYSPEEGTQAVAYPDQIPEEIKEERFHLAMQLQQKVAVEVNRRFMDKTLDVLIEEKVEDNLWIGRSYADAPEVDGVVYVEGDDLRRGTIVPVKITKTLEYDLKGIVLS